MLGKNFEFEDINFRNVFNVHYLYLLLLLLKLIIQHNFTQFKKFFYSSICINTLKRIERQPICLVFFLILSQFFMYSLINIT